MKYKVILFYKYIPIEDPECLKKELKSICGRLELRGRGIIATEGINFILEGTEEDIAEFLRELKKDKRFNDVHFKYSDGTGETLPKLSIKIRDEIVAARLGEDDVKPWETTGKYLQPEELHKWYLSGKKFFIVDMRNGFEQEVGYFKGSINSQFARFDELPKIIPELKKLPKGVPIVTVCTGGVRCEKASGFLVKNGFNQVYQLFGGMHSYMEKYPNGFFKGSLYTFDQRVVMGFNLDDPEREIVGRCRGCNKPSEHYINCKDPFCNRHMIICEKCLNGEDKILCPKGCRDYSLEHPEVFI
jgi:UPF0176 protein